MNVATRFKSYSRVGFGNEDVAVQTMQKVGGGSEGERRRVRERMTTVRTYRNERQSLDVTITSTVNHPFSQSIKCNVCGSKYQDDYRLPGSLREIIDVSRIDGNGGGARARCSWVVVAFSLIVALTLASEAAYGSFNPDSVPLPFSCHASFFLWQLQQTMMLALFFSHRFDIVVNRLWRGGKLYQTYLRLYCYFLVASFVMLCTTSPWPSRILGIPYPPSSSYFNFFKLLNFVTYFCASWTVLLIFWRTNYRIVTIKDVGGGTEEDRGIGKVELLNI